jgi:predicted dehydrogenase
MLNIGIAGIGFMGWIHWLAYQQSPGARVAAICTRDEKKLAGDWTSIKGNFGPPGAQVDLADVKRYRTLDELLADPAIDVVDICLPPDLHFGAAMSAFAAGKHVFCEKPLALTAADCDRMVAAAQQAGKQLVVGHVLPLLPEYAWALATIDSGKYGRALGGTFKRVISDPLWLKDFFDPQKVGGPLVDLHVHDAHFIRRVFGMPTSVFSQGRMRGDVVEYCNTLFQFADPLVAVHAQSGVIQQQGRAFTHAFEIHLERATLLFDFAVIGGEGKTLLPLTVLDSDGKVFTPELPAGDPMLAAFIAEVDELVKSVESNQPSELLGGGLARDAIVLCHKQTESVQRGEKVAIA